MIGRVRFIPAVFLALVLSTGSALGQEASPAPDASQDADTTASLLFVLSTGSGLVEDGTLTLDAPLSLLWFSDRPQRLAGHLTADAFVDLWSEGEDSFAADPPNAVLSIIDDDTVEDVAVVLDSVSNDGGSLSFEVSPFDGTLPEGEIAGSALFVDGVFKDIGNFIKAGVVKAGEGVTTAVDKIGEGIKEGEQWVKCKIKC